MKKIIIAMIALFATTALGQQKDPYADVYANQKRAVYEQNFAKFLDRVKTVSLARHCGVFTNYSWFVGQNLIQSFALQIIGADYPPGWNAGAWAFRFRADVGVAWKEGTALAARPTMCDYWKNNPDQLLAFRNAARAVSSGVGSLPYWFISLQGSPSVGPSPIEP